MYKQIALYFIAILISSCNIKKSQNKSEEEIKSIPSDLVLSDTIPSIQITDKSLAFPQIFEGSYKTQTIVKQEGTDITFDVVNIGNLKISSGKIIATDPVVLSDAIAFKDNFPIGEFPVELAMANIKSNNDRRVAFARLRFSNNQVEKWEFALLPGQAQINIKSPSVYGYGVDAGLGLFIDEAASKKLNIILNKDWENIFSEKFGDFSNYKFDNQNVVFFSTGYGDGFYSTYIGKDKNGEICQLLTDFGIVMWWNLNN